ncbi:hypothetical protein H4R33_005903 [Dimargaris cristalligena]|nr:hypothetical protein H4R33_005903 [Dimargaris cristalligena]
MVCLIWNIIYGHVGQHAGRGYHKLISIPWYDSGLGQFGFGLGIGAGHPVAQIILQTMKLQSAAALTLVFILATVAQAHPSAPATAQSPQLAKRGLRSGAVKMAGAYLGYKAAGAGIDKLRETKKD